MLTILFMFTENKIMLSLRLLILVLLPFFIHAQTASIKGSLTEDGKSVSGVQLVIQPLNKVAVSDENGAFEFSELTAQTVVIKIQSTDYTADSVKLTLIADSIFCIVVQLTPVFSDLDVVVVTGTRTSRRKLDSPIAVNVLDAKTFQRTQAVCLAEGLSFQPGLRMETDCQTYNYTQLRMNGLGGSYSQVLINGRPLFSSLMGLYGLEQIPANAIDRVEIVRGSGSVLYGTNAIAGTINVLTKLPKTDALSVQMSDGLIGMKAHDSNLQANVVAVNDSASAGLTIFASLRNRESLDVDADGFSEIPKVSGTTIGLSSFVKFTPRTTLELAFWHIQEERRGGNKMELQPDETDQAEYRLQNSNIGQLTWSWVNRKRTSFIQVFSGAQLTQRTHYTGIDQANGWGQTRNLTVNSGLQFVRKVSFKNGGKMDFTTGVDQSHDDTYDAIVAYNYVIDQVVNQAGVFLQTDWEITKKWTVLTGIRATKHNLLTNPIYTPRVSVLFKPLKTLQLRFGYGRGFKAPQAFETDMHIAFASGGIATIQRSLDLKSEYSDSWSFAVDWNRTIQRNLVGFTLSAFSTTLNNVFILRELGQDSSGNMQLIRENGGDALVQGITLEGRWKWSKYLQTDLGFTVQQSFYKEAVAWSNSVAPEKRFLRTPNDYGFLTITLFPDARWSGTLAAVYTGKMLLPHFGGAPENPIDLVLFSSQFIDATARLAYNLHVHRLEQNIEIAAGIQNVFDQYQTDFDSGKNRDSNYIYGPAKPRTIFLSLKWSGGDH